MGAIASLVPPAVAVEPGGTATVEVRVRNTSGVLDHFTLTVDGPVAAWAHVQPSVLTLPPGAEGSATLTFLPPRDVPVAGAVSYGVRVVPQEEQTGWVVETGTVEVAVQRDAYVELVPRTSAGWRGGQHHLALDNRGNFRLSASLSAVDAGNELLFRFDPPALTVDAGTVAYSQVRVRARRRAWRGPATTHVFQVQLDTGDGVPLTTEGSYVQQPLLASGAGRVVLTAAAAIVAVLLLWFAVLEPRMEDIAERAAAGRPAGATEPAAGSGSGGGDAGTSSPAASGGQPIDGRLFLRTSGVTSFEVPSGKRLALTDIVLQNPGGNTGTLQMQRDGTPLLVVGLDNFRDLDYHFVSPIVFTSGQKLELVANCTSAGCTPGAYFAGILTDAS